MSGYVLVTVSDARVFYRAVEEFIADGDVDDRDEWSEDESQAVRYGSLECARAVAHHLADNERLTVWILDSAGHYEMIEPCVRRALTFGALW